MSEKKIKHTWFSYGRKGGFGIGFDIDRYHISFDIGFWYLGIEF